jgi:hypothetical protein
MAIEVCTYQDNGVITDAQFVTYIPVPIEVSGTLSDLIQPGDSLVLSETGTLTDLWSERAFTLVSEVGTLSDTPFPAVSDQEVLADSLRMVDALSAAYKVSLSDTLTPTELWDGIGANVLTEYGTATDTLIPANLGSQTLVDGLVGSDTLYPATYVVVAETGTLGDSQPAFSRSSTILTENGVFGEVLAFSAASELPLLTESGTVADATFHTVTTSPVLVDDMFVIDVFLTGDTGAWATNTDAWQMTRYVLPESNSLAVLSHERYIGTAAGLSVFADDQPVTGAKVRSRIFGNQTERYVLPRTMNVGYVSEQPLTVRMLTTKDGTEAVFSYSMPPKVADIWVPGRVALGRGLRSRYMRYEIENTLGGFFQIDTAALDADVSTRRV